MKTAVITGGTRGIGAAIARRLRSDGNTWRVLAISKHPAPCDTDGPLMQYITADLSLAVGVSDAIERIRRAVSHVDLLVNNAGAITSTDSFDCMDDQAAVTSYRLHCVSPVMLAKGLRPLLERGDGSAIVNIGSIYGAIPDVDVAAYAMAKSALPLVTRLMA